jgi:hypothetical protein
VPRRRLVNRARVAADALCDYSLAGWTLTGLELCTAPASYGGACCLCGDGFGLSLCVGSARGLQNHADVHRQDCCRKATDSGRMQSALVGAWCVLGSMASLTAVWFVQAVRG